MNKSMSSPGSLRCPKVLTANAEGLMEGGTCVLWEEPENKLPGPVKKLPVEGVNGLFLAVVEAKKPDAED